jgi:hypothetical protein
VYIDGAGPPVEVHDGPINLFPDCIPKDIDPRLLDRLFTEWHTTQRASIRTLGPIVDTAPVKAMVAVECILRAPDGFEANRTLWEFSVGPVMNAERIRTILHSAPSGTARHLLFAFIIFILE